MVAMGLPDVRKFPFLEPPPPEAIENSVLVLKEQDAMAEDESLTLIGKMLSNLPGKTLASFSNYFIFKPVTFLTTIFL
jgi:HrpA-like RNA helicase